MLQFIAFFSMSELMYHDSSETEDVQARSANMQQVANHIQAHSAGNAVLVFGDTNARYTSSGENIRVFKDQNLMANPWIDLILRGETPQEGTSPLMCSNPSTNSTCETVDKILYAFQLLFKYFIANS